MVIKTVMSSGYSYNKKTLLDLAREIDSPVSKSFYIENPENIEEINLLLGIEEIINKTAPIIFILKKDVSVSFFFVNREDELEYDNLIKNFIPYDMCYYYQLRNCFSDITYKIAQDIDKPMIVAEAAPSDNDYAFKVIGRNIDLKTFSLLLGRKNMRAFNVKSSAELTRIVNQAVTNYKTK